MSETSNWQTEFGSNAAAAVEEARRLYAERKFNRAVACMDSALLTEPNQSYWLRLRGSMLMTFNRFADEKRDFERLTQLLPGDAEAWLELGHCHRALAERDEAERAFLKTLEHSPGAVEAMVSLGALYRETGAFERAIGWLEKAVTAGPSEVRAHCVLGTTLLAAGEAEKGRHSLEKAFALNPYDRTTMAYLYVAFCHTGDMAAATGLIDPQNLIRSYQRDESDDAPESLNSRLAEHIRNHPTLEYQRSGNTTRGGSQTGNLLEENPGPVGELHAWIDERVRLYLGEIPRSDAHPYLAWSPSQWDIDIWAIIIQPGGYQQPHIHPDGWASGVYYAAVPQSVMSGADDDGGCLELGRPPTPFCDSGQYPTRMLRPRPGRLHIFPSFLWHKTLPYESNEERIAVAFDVRPRLQ
jgi:tetratricopeptide (TPR) repeat protein